MGKKRSSEKVGEGGVQDVATNGQPGLKKRRMKEDGNMSKKEEEHTVVPLSTSDMEKKKKRKALVKERRGDALLDQEQKKHKISENAGPVVVSPKSSKDLPEFHISVFKDLATADASVREAAVESLVRELQDIQRAYDQLEKEDYGGPKLEAEKDDGLSDCAPSLRYAIRRLIRGVSSSRECARQGFALGLALLVERIPCVRVDAILKLCIDLLEVSSSMKGQEIKDCLLGRLFVYGALSQTERLVKELHTDKSTPYIKEFTSTLLSLSAKKRYLQEPAVCILLDLVEKLPSESVLTHILDAPGIVELFGAAAESGNPDALLLALKVQERIGGSNPALEKLLPVPFSTSKFFSSDYLSSLANCFKESTFCQPRVHSLWPVIVNILLPEVVLQEEDATAVSSSLKKHKKGRKSSPSEEETSKNLQSFCEVVIEGTLLPSSHDRKHLALNIVLLLLPRLPAAFVQILLSYKVVQCLMDALSSKNSWLFKVAQHFLKELANWVMNDDVRRVAAIVALQKHSNGKFDITTQTKTVKSLVTGLKTESGCMLFIQSLTNMFVDDVPASEEPSDQSQTTDENSEIASVEYKDSSVGNSDFLKIWVVESIPNVLKNLKLDSDSMFRVQKEVMKFLAVQGLFTFSLGNEITSFELQEKFRWPKSATSSSLCKLCIEQLQSLLATASKGEGLPTQVNTVERNDLGAYFIGFLSTLRNIPSVSLFRNLSEEDEKALKDLQDMEIKLYREERNCGLNSLAHGLHAMRYLLIQLLLQVLMQPGEFVEAASELLICSKKVFSVPDLLESPGDDDDSNSEEPELMDVLLDTLLSLLPQSSAPIRTAIEQVFKNFCADVTDDGLQRMLRVIKKDLKPPRRQNLEDVDSDGDDEEDDDLLDIEEEVEADEGGVADDGEIGHTAESDGQTDDSEAPPELASNDEEEGSDVSEDSDEDWDDDKMLERDAQIAQVVRNKREIESAQSQLILFKLRVLSLLEIYLHENPGKPQVLTVYVNLARAFVSAEGSEQLIQRIWGILQKKIFKSKDYPKDESIQLSSLEPLLQRNLRWASKPFKSKSTDNQSKEQSLQRHKMIVSFAQSSTHWILKIIDARNYAEADLQGVHNIFRTVITRFFDSKKSQIKSEFLKEIFQRRPWIGRGLFVYILEKCVSTKSEFRRVDALDLISEILRHLFPSNSSEQNQVSSKQLLRSQMRTLRHLFRLLVTGMPKKKSRRSDVKKFCGKVFQVLSSTDLARSFLRHLDADSLVACESHLSNMFANLKKAANLP